MSWLDRWLKVEPEPEPDPWRSFHARCVDSDGHRREAAMRELPQLPSALHGRALPLVLARLNDWVPQVRAAAAKALPLLLREDLEAAWIDALPEVVRLMGGSRWAEDGAVAREEIEQFLLSAPRRRAVLLASAPGLAPRVRRWLARQSWHHGEAGEKLQALAQALRGGDARLAWQALRHLRAMDPGWRALAGMREALASTPFPALLLDELRQAQAQGRFPSDDEALELAFSRHGGTRSWLLFYAKPALKELVQRKAEAMLDEPGPMSRQLVALQLLRELGAASLRAYLSAALDHPAARLREMAYVLSLPLHEEAERAALACRALADPSPRVRGVALRAQRMGRVALTVADLRAVVQLEPRSLGSVLCALARYEPWTRAPAVLGLLAEQPMDRPLLDEELAALQQALRRSRYAPTPEQTRAVQQSAVLLRQRYPGLVFSPP